MGLSGCGRVRRPTGDPAFAENGKTLLALPTFVKKRLPLAVDVPIVRIRRPWALPRKQLECPYAIETFSIIKSANGRPNVSEAN